MTKDQWQIENTKKLGKQVGNLPSSIRAQAFALFTDIEKDGAYQPGWPHFSSLKGKGIPDECYHCHLKRGRPTYVACWRIIDKKKKIIEVFYVGTHEKRTLLKMLMKFIQ